MWDQIYSDFCHNFSILKKLLTNQGADCQIN
jgi:hypothetical protein